MLGVLGWRWWGIRDEAGPDHEGAAITAKGHLGSDSKAIQRKCLLLRRSHFSNC